MHNGDEATRRVIQQLRSYRRYFAADSTAELETDNLSSIQKPTYMLEYQSRGSKVVAIRPCADIRTMRLLYAIAVAILLCAQAGCAHPSGDPAIPADSSTTNSSGVTSQINILPARDEMNAIVARQATCPDPSTTSLCPMGFCFLYQNNGDSSWATCCPTGWYLQLNAASWSTQKCVLNGFSEPPVRPVNCGNTQGVISGWACVYANQGVNGVATTKWSTKLAIGLSLTWVGMWLNE